MKNTPKVSVVVPTYNYARFLPDAIESVLSQTFTDFELIVVDNCSTDNTDEVVKRYLGDDRVSFHVNETNIGLANNWNKCLELARGEYIKYLCADDKLDPQALAKFTAVLDRYPNVSIVGSHNGIFGDNTRVRKPPYSGVINGQLVRKEFIEDGLRNWLYSPTAVMFRRADAEKVGPFNSVLFDKTDKEFYLRLLSIGDCYVVPEVLSYIRSHGNSQSRTIKGKKYDLTFERYRYLASVKKNTTPKDPLHSFVVTSLKRQAIFCTMIVYRLLPKLYNKEARAKFKTAFQIGKSEGVLVGPLLRFLWQKHVLRQGFPDTGGETVAS